MQNSSASQERATSRTELYTFLERFAHLAKGCDVLNQGQLFEAGSVALRPSEQLLSALKMIDVFFELFDLEKLAAVNSGLQIENMRRTYEEMICRERMNAWAMQSELDALRVENKELKSHLKGEKFIH